MGLHLRPMSALAQLANRFESEIYLVRADGSRFDCKSPISLMGLVATQGTELILEIKGPDQDEALREILALWETFAQYDEETMNS